MIQEGETNVMSRSSSNGVNGTWKLVGGKYNPVSFEIDGHTFGFYQLHTDNYGYMNMADYPSDKTENKVELAEVRNHFWQAVSSEFDTAMANKIFYNATHKHFTFNTFIVALEKEGITYKAN